MIIVREILNLTLNCYGRNKYRYVGNYDSN